VKDYEAAAQDILRGGHDMTHVTWGVIIACGKGEQLSPEVDTPFLNLGSKPVLTYSLLAYERCLDVAGVVVAANKDRVESVLGMCQMFGFSKVQKVVAGGSQRQTSVINALKALDDDVSIVSVHDASRPCITADLIAETVKAAKRYGSGVLATEIVDVVKAVEKGLTVSKTLNNGVLWTVQTPQTFRRDVLEKAYQAASRKKLTFEDDSSVVELIGEEVHLVTPSGLINMRIRSPGDFNLATALVKP
jgi:2-C-methyl-D-erythritol 4-phosphate cytidylyltransferase